MNYLEIKASLAETIRKLLNQCPDSVLSDTVWDLSNSYPTKPLAAPDASEGCSHRARFVVSNFVGDPALGAYVTNTIKTPKYRVCVVSKDIRIAEYLGSILFEMLNTLPMIRIDAFVFSEFDPSINMHKAELILCILLGSVRPVYGRKNCSVDPVPDDNCCGLG